MFVLMKVVVQRARNASVTVDDQVVGAIDHGFVLLVGLTQEDTLADVEYCAKKVANLRVFEDAAGKMNKSIQDEAGSILSISQFTLYGDTKKGNRPSFIQAAPPQVAQPLYEQFNQLLRDKYGITVETGVFGAMMNVSFTNVGPTTLMIES